jgi:hypothetical protein
MVLIGAFAETRTVRYRTEDGTVPGILAWNRAREMPLLSCKFWSGIASARSYRALRAATALLASWSM